MSQPDPAKRQRAIANARVRVAELKDLIEAHEK
jgi:hypothetical protein